MENEDIPQRIKDQLQKKAEEYAKHWDGEYRYFAEMNFLRGYLQCYRDLCKSLDTLIK